MTKLILLAIAAIGSISALVLWILKRWYTSDYKISKLKEKVDELTNQIVSLETLPRAYSRVSLLHKLYKEREELNREIRRRTDAKPKGLLSR